MFRPCIDLHEGKVKQIVGSSLKDGEGGRRDLVTNFESEKSSAWYADLYRHDELPGGHIIMLGPGNEAAAREALATWPNGMQVGGGISSENAQSWIDAGASHVIVTSWVFRHGQIDFNRLSELVECIGAERLVLDLSCRKRDGRYYVVTDRWQVFTETVVEGKTLEILSNYCSEFLAHGVDVEGKQAGIDLELVRLLGSEASIPTTYAGGARTLEDLEQVWEEGRERVDLTIGSALDIFGGTLPYAEVVAWDKKHR